MEIPQQTETPACAATLDDFLIAKILSSGFFENDFLIELRCCGTRLKHIVDTILKSRFLTKWGLNDKATNSPPPSPTAYNCRLHNFARCHRLRQGCTESLTAIALMYNTDPSTLRRFNALISDHSLMSREEMFVPLSDVEQLRGCTASFQYNTAAHHRPMWVVRSSSDDGDDGGGSGCAVRPSKRAEATEKLMLMMKSAIGVVDSGTCRYYLAASGGDVKAAMAAYREDMRWDRCMKHLKKSLLKSSSSSSSRSKR